MEAMCDISRLCDVISEPNLLENRFRYRGMTENQCDQVWAAAKACKKSSLSC